MSKHVRLFPKNDLRSAFTQRPSPYRHKPDYDKLPDGRKVSPDERRVIGIDPTQFHDALAQRLVEVFRPAERRGEKAWAEHNTAYFLRDSLLRHHAGFEADRPIQRTTFLAKARAYCQESYRDSYVPYYTEQDYDAFVAKAAVIYDQALATIRSAGRGL